MLKKLAKMGKKKANKKSEKCIINSKVCYHTICFKQTDSKGKVYGYIRKNKVYIQVVKSGKIWRIPRVGIAKMLFGA